jgi:peptidyl-prolyl cis-trans isomerase A (cyclophilin A)
MHKLFVGIIALSAMTFAQTSTTPKKVVVNPAAAPKTTTTTTPPAKQPIQATFQTTAGDINCTLFPDKAPMTVANFVGLATGAKEWKNPANGATMHNRPLYDGTIFHRVIPNFMIQGGDPLGNGIGDPGYKFKDEFSDLRFDQPGRLAMANSGPDTNGSQFFITDSPQPHLDSPGHYTIFGQCENLDVVKQIARQPTGMHDRPVTPVKITHVKIVDPNKPAAAPAKKPATAGTSNARKPPSTTPKPQ